MCGIWFCLGPMNRETESAEPWVRALHARGPEAAQILKIPGVGTAGFTRLAINGLDPAGMQPFSNDRLIWMCNGEIYNWRALAAEYGILCESGSDCEVLGPLYEKFLELGLGVDAFFRALDGVFAIVIVDMAHQRLIVGRDPYGVRPLYCGQRMSLELAAGSTAAAPIWKPKALNWVFASELKALSPFCEMVSAFLPGHYQVYSTAASDRRLLETARYHTVPSLKVPLLGPGLLDTPEMATLAVRDALMTAVRKRLMTERPVAALLSGGVDSSLIAALVARELKAAGAPPLRTFSIGMLGSSDLFYARKVAEHIGSEHTEVVLTAEDFFNAIGPVIQAIESYDTTTVRASVGNWLVSKAIKEQSDCKVVFNGDGSDEVWGSYLYFYNAPSDAAFEEEVTRLLGDIHYFDVLRSDRSIASHGLEPRTPFLDKQFVATARAVATQWRRPVRGVRPEKWLMRKAFEGMDLLPREVLWRQKEAFSDGVSGQERSWYQIAQEKAAEMAGPEWRERAERSFGAWLPPQTPEQYYYRYLYEAHFGKPTASVNVPYFWMPRWCAGATDPSARTLAVYSDAGASPTAGRPAAVQ
jgi:asparagine synthase (glutamine-hydrolysing)